jgi:Domain of unknown function (DUF5122) beta-propeller
MMLLLRLLPVIALIWLTACGGSDSSTPQSTTNQSPSTAQEPTKPPPTTQPPSMAPPSSQQPGSQPPGSTPPGSGSSGAFTQGRGFNSDVRQLVMAQDGSHDLYVGGDFTTYNGTAANHLIRLRPNGTIAQSFGQGFDEVVVGLGLATDGSNALYASGPFTQFNGQPVPHVIRLTRTGVRDATFQAGSLGFDFGLAAVPEDGTRDVYVGGGISRSRPEGNSGLIARLNADGTADSTYPVVDFRTPGDSTVGAIAALAVPPGTGKLYVGGSMATYNGEGVGSFVRLNPDGTLDRTFPINTTSPSTSTTIVEAIAPARDGSGDVYVGGRIGSYNGTPVNGSMRIHDNGVLDTSYVQGTELVPFVICPAQDGTGDVLMSGFTVVSPNVVFRLLRFDRTGAVVSTFHEPALGAEAPNDGLVLSIVPALDGTKNLYIGGLFTTYNGVPVNHIARIHADGSLASVVE